MICKSTLSALVARIVCGQRDVAQAAIDAEEADALFMWPGTDFRGALLEEYVKWQCASDFM